MEENVNVEVKQEVVPVKKERMLEQDIAKGIGILLVLALHTLTLNNMNEILEIISNELDSYNLEQVQQNEFDVSSDDMLNAFLSAKELEGRSPKTLERYKYIITRLLIFTKTLLNKIVLPLHSFQNYKFYSYLQV